MHCPMCGAESTQGLNYCKRCGSNLTAPIYPINRPDDSSPRVRVAAGTGWAVALATVAVTLGGLGIVFNLAFDLMRPTFPGSTAVPGAALIAGLMIGFGSATVFGIVALLMRLFSRLLSLGQEKHESSHFRKQPVTGEPKPVQISAPPSVIPSVTEQTTRNFDPALYRDRES